MTKSATMYRTGMRYEQSKSIMDAAARYARATYAAHVEADALEDEALNAFLYVDRVWEASRGASFTTLLRRCLHNRFSNLSRRRARQYALGKATAKSISALHLTDELAAFIPGALRVGDDSTAMLERIRPSISRVAYKLACALLIDDHLLPVAREQLELTLATTKQLLAEITRAAFDCESEDALIERARELHVIAL